MQQKNKDRFRTRFCTADYYSAHQESFTLWKSRLLTATAVEKVQCWVILLACLRRPDDWFGGLRQKDILTAAQVAMLNQPQFKISDLMAHTPIRWPLKLSRELSLLEFLSCVRIKALPESVFRSLCALSTGHYPLILSTGVPTPAEILTMQLQGKRVLSYNEDHKTWPETLYNGRDFLGFVIHDLIHADHFFRESQHRNGQLGFYRFITSVLHDSEIQSLLNQHEKFKEGFEYIISDMNSHPVHLFQTFHSLLFSSLKDDTKASSLWAKWSDDQTQEASIAIKNINSVGFHQLQAQQIEDFCISLGQKTSL